MLHGTFIANKILDDLRSKTEKYKLQNKIPTLCVVQVIFDTASKTYVKQKHKIAKSLEWNFIYDELPENTSEDKVIEILQARSNDISVHGIILQLPLPKHLNQNKLLQYISPKKDVDGLTITNQGKLLSNTAILKPCTPQGCLAILDEYNFSLKGKHVAIFGRSILVGKPLALMLSDRGATVSIINREDKNQASISQNANLICIAIGQKHYLTSKHVNEKAWILDIGMNKSNDKWIGDVNTNITCAARTPVPGGVGPLTVAYLMKNTMIAFEKLENDVIQS